MLKGISLAIPLFATMACATMPRTGIEDNGKPLRVAVENRKFSYTVKEKVGDAVHKDAAGNVVGTTEITRDAVRTRRYKVWDFYQGRTLIDEADFFRLAGDPATSDYIINKRKKGMFYQKLGGYTMLGSGAGLLAFLYLFSDSAAARNGLTSLFTITLSVGGVMLFYGRGQVQRRTHMPLNRALDAYDAYMEEQGGGMAGRL